MPDSQTVKFPDAMEALSAMLSQMGGLVEEQLLGAIDAVVRRDTGLAENVVAMDPRVDTLQQQIETKVTRMISLRHLQEAEVRELLSAIKIAGDLERMGDLAKNVAKRSLVLGRDYPEKHLAQGLARMGRLAATQVKTVLDAYAQRDTNAAGAVWRRDEEIDELYNSLFRELLTYMMEDPRKISASTHLLFIAKNFERVGDHATNIAEIVHYLVHGATLGDQRPKSDITSSTAIPFGTKS
jgi:phosphate transport system protein